MLERLTAYINDNRLFDATTHLLLAVSGGIDSVVLTHLMTAAGYRFEMAHCNFHLRPGECDRDEVFVTRLADQYGVPLHVAHFDTEIYAREHHLSVEEAARELRYRFFAECVSRWTDACVVTAHHRDDSVETFFINLLRGTGIAGLTGIKPTSRLSFTTPSIKVAHPLLPFSRAEITAYAEQKGLTHVEDSTNRSSDYRRNRIRHEVLPLLRDIQPTADLSLQRAMHHLDDVAHIYNDAVDAVRRQIAVVDGAKTSFAVERLLQLHPLRTWLFELLRPFGFCEAQLDNISAALHRSSGKRFYSATHCLIRERETLVVSPLQECDDDPMPKIQETVVDKQSYLSSNGTLRVGAAQALFDADRLRRPLHLRHWQGGDRFQPYGMTGTRLLSDFFSDAKFTTAARRRQWLLCDSDDSILWVVGHRADGRYAVDEITRNISVLSLG